MPHWKIEHWRCIRFMTPFYKLEQNAFTSCNNIMVWRHKRLRTDLYHLVKAITSCKRKILKNGRKILHGRKILKMEEKSRRGNFLFYASNFWTMTFWFHLLTVSRSNDCMSFDNLRAVHLTFILFSWFNDTRKNDEVRALQTNR